MHVLFFLKRRSSFINEFYQKSSGPFFETKRKINDGEEPYEPVWDGSEEPPYTSEWIAADESIQIIGYTCLSMLAASLHLYLKTWEQLSGKTANKENKTIFKKAGWFTGYRKFFETEIGVLNFAESGANLELLKELVLARNRIQHPESIANQLTTYTGSDLEKLPHVLFVDPQREVVSDIGPNGAEEWLIPPTVSISRKTMSDAIFQVEKFTDWFENAARIAIYGDA